VTNFYSADGSCEYYIWVLQIFTVAYPLSFSEKNISISHKRSVLLSISGSVVAMLEAVMSFVPVEKIAVQKSLANILTSLQVSKDIFSVLST
jgi:hypothetical protein